MLSPIIHAVWLLCSAITVKTADCAAPIKHIHVVSDNWAGYLLRVDAWNFQFPTSKNVYIKLTKTNDELR